VRTLKVLLTPLTLLLATGVGLFFVVDGEPAGGQTRSAAFPGKPGQIAFVRGGKRRGIYVADPSGNKVRRITRGYDRGPAWSPDGRRIAFTRGGETSSGNIATYRGIYVVNASGSGLRRVLKDRGSHTEKPFGELALPTWSPDGARLAFEYKDGLGVVNLDGTGARTLLTNAEGSTHTTSEPTWSPDGKTLAFARLFEPDGLWVLDMASGQQRRVTGDCNFTPNWSPDGRKIACSSLLKRNAGIHVVDLATATAQRLTSKAALKRVSYAPSWSPDGLRIVFGKYQQLTSRKEKSDVYVMNSDGTRQHRLIRNGFDPDWGRQP
jgi:TolB protein